jgi:hypothetical protein
MGLFRGMLKPLDLEANVNEYKDTFGGTCNGCYMYKMLTTYQRKIPFFNESNDPKSVQYATVNCYCCSEECFNMFLMSRDENSTVWI